MKNIWLTFLIIGSLVLVKCSGEEDDGQDPEPVIVNAPTVSAVQLDDITNNGNATDLEVFFNQASDETKIAEYRVFVVPGAMVSEFNIEAAALLEPVRYMVRAKNGLRQRFVLDSSVLDVEGNTINDGGDYSVFVMSIADGTNATINTLSSQSNAVTLQETSIKITYIGNDGVYISDGKDAVIIDALTGNISTWKPSAAGVQNAIERGSGDFRNVKVAMVTHNHGDHFSPTAINSFLARNPEATFIAPPQALGGITNTAQVSNLNPARGNSSEETFGDIKVKVLNVRHFDMFGNNFSGVQNFGFIVEIGGKKVLHLGDFDYTTNNLSPFNLTSENIDAVLIPTFNTLISSSNNTLIANQIRPKEVICLHLQSNTSADQVKAAFPNAHVFTTSLQFVRL